MAKPFGTRVGDAVKELESAQSIEETRETLARLRTEDPNVYAALQDEEGE